MWRCAGCGVVSPFHNVGTTGGTMEPTDVTAVVVNDDDLAQHVDGLSNAEARIRVVGRARSPSEAASAVCRLLPDLVILCVRDRPDVALVICHEMNVLDIGANIVIQADRDDDRTLPSFIRAGVQGYVTRSMTADESLKVFLDVARGRLVFPRAVARRVRTLVMSGGSPRIDNGLTDRETQVLEQMSCGLRNQEIATALGISNRTVETHVRRVLLKFGATSRTQAVARAIRSGGF